jgi:hypothetical protein
MTEQPDNTEKQQQEQRLISNALKYSFKSDGKDLASKDQTSEEEKKHIQREAAYGNKFQGDVGEGITERVATDKLGLTPDPRFDKSEGGHGIDTVYLQGKGRPVIVESKCDERGIKALRGDQMQPEWIDRNARLMQTPGNERYTPGNAEIGREIDKIGADKVRRIVIVTDPTTLEARVYEGQVDRTWKLIGSWDAFNIEQPNLK